MYKNLLCFLIAVFFSFSICAQSGKLNKAKKSLQTTSQPTSKSTKKVKSSSTSNNNNIENPLARILWSIVAYTAYGIAFESPLEYNGKMHDAEIAHYPFEGKNNGNFIYTDSTNYNITRFDIYNRFLIENKSLYGNNFGFDFRFFKRFSFNAEYLSFVEKIENTKDSFYFYAAILKYHRIRLQRFDAWFGLGATRVANGVNKTGFTFAFGGEWFIKKPVSVLFSHNTTAINSQNVNNTKLLLKYHLKNYRISSGYENYILGDSKINAFSLGVEVSF